MLILIAVSVQIVISSGLFESSKVAAKKTADAFEKEGNLGNSININGKIYNSVEEYVGSTEDEPAGEIATFILEGYGERYEFSFVVGTTWEEFFDSGEFSKKIGYNSHCAGENEDVYFTMVSASEYIYILLDGTNVQGHEKIIKDASYTTVAY